MVRIDRVNVTNEFNLILDSSGDPYCSMCNLKRSVYVDWQIKKCYFRGLESRQVACLVFMVIIIQYLKDYFFIFSLIVISLVYSE